MGGKEAHKTALITCSTLNKYNKIAFELKNAPATFHVATIVIRATVKCL